MAIASVPPFSLSWPGCGVMVFWQLGVMRGLSRQMDLADVPMLGSSSGSFITALAGCGCDPDDAAEELLELLSRREHEGRRVGLLGVLGGVTRTWLDTCLPADAGALLSRGTTSLLVTELPLLRTRHVTHFASKQDVVDTAMASAHLPLVLDGTWWTYLPQQQQPLQEEHGAGARVAGREPGPQREAQGRAGWQGAPQGERPCSSGQLQAPPPTAACTPASGGTGVGSAAPAPRSSPGPAAAAAAAAGACGPRGHGQAGEPAGAGPRVLHQPAAATTPHSTARTSPDSGEGGAAAGPSWRSARTAAPWAARRAQDGASSGAGSPRGASSSPTSLHSNSSSPSRTPPSSSSSSSSSPSSRGRPVIDGGFWWWLSRSEADYLHPGGVDPRDRAGGQQQQQPARGVAPPPSGLFDLSCLHLHSIQGLGLGGQEGRQGQEGRLGPAQRSPPAPLLAAPARASSPPHAARPLAAAHLGGPWGAGPAARQSARVLPGPGVLAAWGGAGGYGAAATTTHHTVSAPPPPGSPASIPPSHVVIIKPYDCPVLTSDWRRYRRWSYGGGEQGGGGEGAAAGREGAASAAGGGSMGAGPLTQAGWAAAGSEGGGRGARSGAGGGGDGRALAMQMMRAGEAFADGPLRRRLALLVASQGAHA